MTRHRCILSLALGLIAAPSPTGLAEVPADAANRVDAIFDEWSSLQSPGCAVGVAKDGLTIFSRAYGMADLEHDIPNRPETVFEGGSVSKQFTAAAIVLLAIEGKLSLDDDVRTHVPEVPDYGTTITIRHLMNHISGLRDWGSVAAISGWGRQSRTHTHDHVLDIVGRQTALNFLPGDEYSYSNTGYNLMAVIVSRVSDMSFADFSSQHIFRPLGMKHTQWRDDYTRIVKGRSTAYSVRDGHVAIMRPIEDVHGNGGILTTVSDLLTWNEALTTGRLGGKKFQDLMHQQGQLNSGRRISYAAGLRVTRLAGEPAIVHTGSTSGYRAFLGRFPESRLSVAMLCNASNVRTGASGEAIARAFFGTKQASLEDETPAPPSEQLANKAGLYRNARTGMPVRLLLEGDHLLLDGGTSLVPVGESKFQAGPQGPILSFEASTSRRASFRLLNNEDSDDVVFEPVDEVRPGEADLGDYEGHYESVDAETLFKVSSRDGKLLVARRPAFEVELEASYADAFEAPGLGFIRFHRASDGRVIELSLRQPRVYDMRFQRKPDP